MDDLGPIRRRSDGSIDTGYYRDVARRLRSATVQRLLLALTAILRSYRVNASTGPAAGDEQP